MLSFERFLVAGVVRKSGGRLDRENLGTYSNGHSGLRGYVTDIIREIQRSTKRGKIT